MVDRKKIIKIFKASPTPTSIVKANQPHFTFINVNDAYVEMTQSSESELIGKSLFEAFPENPEEEKPTGVERLRNSFIKVINTKSEDEMYGIRYDIILDDGKYKQLYWKIVNTPVLDEKGEVEFIINSATNITEKYRSDLEKKLMLNNSEDSFILIDKILKILNFNDQFAENYFDIFDKKIKKGDSILDYAQPERRETVKGIYDRVFNGETISNELPLPTVDGETRHFTIKYKPATNDHDEIIGSFISLIEITNEKKAWDQLEEKEARFRALVENGSDILFILNKDGNPTYSSPSVKHVLGYTPEEIIEMDFFEKAHPDDIPMIEKEIKKCLDKPGEPIEVPPARLKDKEGKWHWFEGTITNMLHEPAIGGIVDNFKEVTERIEAEKEIQQAKEQYQSLVQTINGIVWESDADTFVFNYVSPQAKSILGYDPEKWVGTPEFWKNKIHPEDREKTVQYSQNETKEGRNHSFEYRMRKANREYIWLQDVVTVVKEDGKPVSLRGLMIDITQEKELESKLESAYDLAKIGTWELDLQNEKLHWSDYVKKLHEVDLDYKPDLDSAINFYKEGWSRESITEEVNKTIETGIPFDVELIIVTYKGNERWVRAVGEPEFIGDTCIRIYGSTQDITERKEAELA
ncbi:PAS domain S-box protein [Gracilimonas sp.]|uniref:PAS domain S-box protein n=1 Tax=Gracilimonas sp. TaxID=1974203 RepID=UPI002871BF67|nr:PAS domain S-box protein [Gracilimonas sp.]